LTTAAQSINEACGRVSIELPPGAAERLLAFVDLIAKWNRVHNLTAIRDPQRMITEHLLDSLSIVSHVVPSRVLDVGSGAGLPGIPLAIARPQWQVTLLESSHKRCAFLRQAAIDLGLVNASIECERIESFRPEAVFETIVSRAFSDTPHFARVAAPHLAASGVILAMKGLYPHEELAQLPAEVELRSVVPLMVPGLDAQRHLVVMTKA
jgi:16S rRNA (guanine527-N7)-methyltransferase